MKNIIYITICTILSFSSNLFAQSEWLDKGDTEYELMEFKEAIRSYQEHIKLYPEDKETLVKLAECYHYINEWDNAAKTYYEALSYSVSTELLLTHGLIQMKLARYEAAKEQFMIYANVNETVGSNYARMCDYAFSRKDIPALFKVDKLPVSSNASDFSPAFLGKDLAYVSGRKDIQRTDAINGAISGNDRKFNFVFKTETEGIGKPEYVRSWFHDNNLINEGAISYSANGEWVAYVENTYVEGVSKLAFDLFKGNIFIAKVSENGDWIKGSSFPYNGNHSNNFPYLSADGNTLYYASDQEGGEGGYDIYMSTRQNGVWSQPRNMGPTINKPGNEITPYIDGDDFYFSSDYLSGFGGQDIFKANYRNGIWKIMNLGTGVNTSANDFGFIYNRKRNLGYLTSDRENFENIYKVVKTSDDINIVVLDAATRIPVPSATLDFKNCGKGVFKANVEGRFGFKASTSSNCFVSINKLGYETKKLDIGPNTNGLIEVFLYKEGEMYEGKVVDGIHDTNMNNVRVRVVNQANGQKYEVYSNDDGVYALALEPYSAYMIQYDKIGYVGVGDKVETEDGSDKGILGSQLLFPTDSEGMESIVPSVPNPTIDPNGITVPTPTITTPSPTMNPPIENGFSVQLVSLSAKNKNFPEKVKLLKGKVSRVYTKTDEKWRRYRVGTYMSKTEAKSVLDYIKAVGFETAFIVEEDAKGIIKDVAL